MSESSEGQTNVSNQLAVLVPTFDPSKDDLQIYSQKVMLLLEAWPPNKYTELATRLILNCSGSAFKKLQLHQSEVTQNDRKSIQKIIELLGGHWGQIDLEQRYEYAEKALYKCQQKSDESADSYLARADIMWTELNSRKFQLSDLQAYVTLRGSTLTAEDKKRVLLDSDAANKGSLTVEKVSSSIRMLGAGFFHEMTAGRRTGKLKTYDQTTLMAEDQEEMEPDQTAFSAETMDDDEEAMVVALAQEGDEDASLVADFEAAASELLQNDDELAAAYNAYADARRRLNDKVRNRGFWPIGQKGRGKGFNKGVKGKFNKGHSSSRKSLQQRILESRCRLCGKMGHWKAECPNKGDSGTGSRAPQAPTTFVQVTATPTDDPDAGLPLEFLRLPAHETTLDDTQINFSLIHMVVPHESTRSQLRKSLNRWQQNQNQAASLVRTDDDAVPPWRHRLKQRALGQASMEPSKSLVPADAEPTCFASHGSYGIVDLGATKTVMGSKLVPELLNHLHPSIRQQVTRCPCSITFRFGNHGVLESKQALVIPIQGLLLKIAVVPGSTPLLLSNTLLRALQATVDTENQVLHSRKTQQSFPLTLTSKGLFLLDLNVLAQKQPGQSKFSRLAETHPAEDIQVEAVESSVKTSFAAPSRSHQSQVMFQHREASPYMSHEEIQMSDSTCQSTDRTKRFPSSFRVIDRDRHDQPCTAPPEGPSGDHRSQAGSLSHVPSRDEGSEDQFRQDPPWSNVSRHVGQRAELDHMVRPEVLQLRQGRAHGFPEVRRTDGGKSRADRPRSPADQPEGGREDPVSHRSSGLSAGSEPRGQGQSQGDGDGTHPDVPVGLRRRPGDLRDALGDSSNPGECQDHELGESHAGGRDCAGKYPSALGGHESDHGHPTVRDQECPSLAAQTFAGDVSAECFASETQQETPETNHERKLFNKFVQQYTTELSQIQNNTNSHGYRLDVLEIFCGPQSQLTSQSQQLGLKAERFGLQQGDLHTISGRHDLFRMLCQKKPKHVWFSPKCGPWSGFSCLNGSRSLEAWDELQRSREESLQQIALGIVVLRFQRQHENHFHWEQPRGSLMFKLPYLQEALYYLLSVDVDLCVAGELKDPENGKLIRKSLAILSTSHTMVQELSGLRCQHDHVHQVIEGQVKYKGENISRSTFTENYPRKFARRVAKIFGKFKYPRETPYRNDMWQILATEEHPEATAAKRPRRERYTSMKLSRALEVSKLPWGKRRKMSSKTSPIDAKQQWSTVFSRLTEILPRVGKCKVQDPEIMELVQNLIGDKQIEAMIACRGSSRTLAPPEHLQKGVAPLRRSVFIERGTGEIRAEDDWENWENLAKRNLIRPSHETRINLTVFAKERPPAVTHASPNQDSAPAGNLQGPSESKDNSNACRESEGSEEIPAPISETTPQPVLSQELSRSQQADISSMQQSARFRSLPRDEQIALLRAHKNLGHPSPERLSTILRSQGYRSEVAQAALELKCSICQESSTPKLARPGSLKEDLDFNDKISIDGLEWTNKQGTTFHVYHIVDWSTNFHVARVAPDRSSSSAIQIIIDMWMSWAGAPSELLVDAATEFNSEQFCQFVQSYNIKLTTISPEAHFQNGRVERHGSILKTMLNKYESDHEITSYQDMSQALFWCTQAKNASSLKRGYAPEVLVFGKHSRLPGAVCSDELIPAHLLAESETAHGVAFRRQLACRESARKAFIYADNDSALRRAMLRRTRPGGLPYSPGKWVMCWKLGKGAMEGHWIGPMKVVVHENAQTIWTTQGSKIYRCAPEHVRPVSSNEARMIPITSKEPSVSIIAQQLPQLPSQGITRAILNPPDSGLQDMTGTPEPPGQDTQSEVQPDDEPEAPSHKSQNSITSHNPPNDNLHDENNQSPNPMPSEITDPTITTPIPEESDDDLYCEGYHCLDIDDPIQMCSTEQDAAWRCEIHVTEDDIQSWKEAADPAEMTFVVSAAKRQRAEVKMSQLTPTEKAQFQQAKSNEIQNWLNTGTISRILRSQVPHDQILRCRWILTWKPVDAGPEDNHPESKPKMKAKARLVILGYLDPKLEELPRDSPTLGRNAKMLSLQLIASKGWILRSFDIRAAFLQGKPQEGRTLAVEPVPELIEALQLATNEVCKLEKGAYGLIDAPYLWYMAISEELRNLGFSQSPFDPCQFILRHETTGALEGVIGLHVDDGICGGSQYFEKKLAILEKKYPFGSKKMKQFTFTGIEMDQLPSGTITMKQTKYVNAIPPISMKTERKNQGEEPVTEEERQKLRALIGSLQYAAVHTRPDLSSRLSQLQSSINRATVNTISFANQTLHEAKKHSDTTIQIQAIPVDDFRFLAFSDASFASKGNPSSHTGCMIMGTHKLISQNVSCPVSPLSWGSKKIQRVVTSTLAAETVSLSSVLDHLSWLRLCWGWMLDPSVQWKQPSDALLKLPETYSTATYRTQHLPESLAATDCKSLYDLVTRTAVPNCSEYRTQLNARAIKDFLAEGVQLRWAHSGAQLADSLTKIMENSFLRATLHHGHYKLHDELEVLKSRATTRNRLRWLKGSEQKESNDQGCNDECLLSINNGFLGV